MPVSNMPDRARGEVGAAAGRGGGGGAVVEGARERRSLSSSLNFLDEKPLGRNNTLLDFVATASALAPASAPAAAVLVILLASVFAAMMAAGDVGGA